MDVGFLFRWLMIPSRAVTDDRMVTLVITPTAKLLSAPLKTPPRFSSYSKPNPSMAACFSMPNLKV